MMVPCPPYDVTWLVATRRASTRYAQRVTTDKTKVFSIGTAKNMIIKEPPHDGGKR